MPRCTAKFPRAVGPLKSADFASKVAIASRLSEHGIGGPLVAGSGGEVVRVWVEPPEGWGPTRALLGRLEALGYRIEEHRIFDAVGRSILVITG